MAEAVDGKVRVLDPPDRVWESGLTHLEDCGFSGYSLFFEAMPEKAVKPTKKAGAKKKKKASKPSKTGKKKASKESSPK